MKQTEKRPLLKLQMVLASQVQLASIERRVILKNKNNRVHFFEKSVK